MSMSIRAKIDAELTKHISKWFTVRQIQNKLRVAQSTLKPLIMRYARENVLRRRHIKGTARSVEFSPATGKPTTFKTMLVNMMPYRNVSGRRSASKTSSKSRTSRRSTRRK